MHLQEEQKAKNFEFGLILIGDELLSGRRADKHLPKVIELLHARGQSLSWMQCIGDDPQRIIQVLTQAFASKACVFSCGGIGATPDDYTRQCAAKALGVELELHLQAKELIHQRSKAMAEKKGEVYQEDSPEALNRLNMGVFPKGASIIPNPYNGIPGFSCQDVHFFPGFPVMAWPMMEWVLDQHYAGMLQPMAHAERAIVVYGAAESTLTPLMVELEQNFTEIKIFSLPSVDHPVHGRHIELGVKGAPEVVDHVFELMVQRLNMMAMHLGPELPNKHHSGA